MVDPEPLSASASDLELPGWEEALGMGSIDELRRWAVEDHHFDPDDPAWVLRMSATSIITGAWRNESPIEDIHVGANFKPDYPGERGLRDAEMMAASMNMTARMAEVLANVGRDPQKVFEEIASILTDFRSPFSGRPGDRCLKDMLTKAGMSRTSKKVRQNLTRFELVQSEVGWDRFLFGTALCAANNHVFWGNPAWPTQVRTWADRTESETGERPSALEAALVEDPFSIPVGGREDHDGVTLSEAVGTAIGYVLGDRRWHADRCGDGEHRPTKSSARVTGGLFDKMGGLPSVWLYGVLKRP